MEKNQRPILISALSAIFLLMFVTFITMPQNEVWALQIGTASTGNQKTDIVEPIVYNNWNAFVTASGNSSINAQNVLVINASNDVVLANFSLTDDQNGNHKYIDGISCQNTGQLYHSSTVSKGGTEFCVITMTGGTGSDRVFLIDVTDGTLPHNFGSGTSYANGYLAQRCLINGIPQLQGSAICYVWDSSGTNKIYIDTLPFNYTIQNNKPIAPQIGKAFGSALRVDTGGVGSNANDFTIYTFLSPVNGHTVTELAWTSTSGTILQLWNLDTASAICQTNLGVSGYTIQFGVTGQGVNSWYVNVDNLVKIVTDSSCGVSSTLSLSTYDPSGTHIRGLYVTSVLNQLYLLDDQQKLLAINNTTPYPLFTSVNAGQDCINSVGSGRRCIAVVDNPSIGGNTIIDNGQTDVAVASTTNNIFTIVYWGNKGSTSSTGGGQPSTAPCPNPNNPNCVGDTDCSLPQYYNLAMCVLHRNTNGGAINSTAGYVTTNIKSIICSVGMANCTNTNNKTNGVGYLLELILLLVTVAMFLYASKMVLNIPIYVWILITLIDLAIGVALGWIDITFFVLGAIAVVALASGKIKNLLYGEQF